MFDNHRQSSPLQSDVPALGIDCVAKIEQVRLKDPRVALQLELQLHFGLRAREAMQLRPYLADKETFLSITHGPKGGRIGWNRSALRNSGS